MPTLNTSQNLAETQAAYDRGDHTTALQLLRPLAESGSSAAQYLVGSMHEAGKGLPLDLEQAAAWYRKAAKSYHDDASIRLALLLIEERIAQQEGDAIITWYMKAEQRCNHAELEYRLGLLCSSKKARAQYHPAYAASMLRKAAEKHHAMAQYTLGQLYEKGVFVEEGPYRFHENEIGIPRDLEQSLYWYRKAADQGLECALQSWERLRGLPATE